eukprot:TRINITY_DN40679_c0_g1_i1.p1 TRINITY_DN40679_c0_g1~~TRINITY_DN40679_c0_g1_i1.p1  ORF type:complete len:440 (+),score=44.79 TRINITY_DN40679_c0_g1_i1:66-1385(+)
MSFVGETFEKCCGRRHGKQAPPAMTYGLYPTPHSKASSESIKRVDCSKQGTSSFKYPEALSPVSTRYGTAGYPPKDISNGGYAKEDKFQVPWDVVGKPMLPLLECNEVGPWEPKLVRAKLHEALKRPEKPEWDWSDFNDPGTEVHHVPSHSKIRNSLTALRIEDFFDGLDDIPSEWMGPSQVSEVRSIQHMMPRLATSGISMHPQTQQAVDLQQANSQPITCQPEALLEHPPNLSQSSPHAHAAFLENRELSNSSEVEPLPLPPEMLDDSQLPQTQSLPQETSPSQPPSSRSTDLRMPRSIAGSPLRKVEHEHEDVSTPIVGEDVRDGLEAPCVQDEQTKRPAAINDHTPASPSEPGKTAMGVPSESNSLVRTPSSALISSGGSSPGTRSQKTLRFDVPLMADTPHKPSKKRDVNWRMLPQSPSNRKLGKSNPRSFLDR